MKAQLLIATGDLAGKVVYLATGQDLKVGRTFCNDIALNDPGVSREHAVFSWDGVSLTVKDQHSRNGIFVNHQRVEAAVLQSGDEVALGATVFQVATNITDNDVMINPPTEMPWEGIRAGVDLEADGSDAELRAVGPTYRDDATADVLPPADAHAAQQDFLATHSECSQCGRVIGHREDEPAAAHDRGGRRLCPECARPDVGRVVGSYRLVELLADGKTGRIFKAEHLTIKKVVAIKILLEHFASREPVKLRFLREARAGAALNHPHIVNMFDAGEDKGTYFLVMEYVEGTNLQKLLERDGPLAPDRALVLAAHIARALEYAHGKGIVHRDVRPANVLVAVGDRAKLIDTGTAKWIEATGVGTLTQPGVVFGDFNYLAPELLHAGQQIDPMCDIFSLGATLYTMLAGRPAYRVQSLGEAIEQVQSGPIPPPSAFRPGIPPELDRLTLRLMNFDPVQRASSTAALVEELTDMHARTSSAPQADAGAEVVHMPSEVESDLRLARDIQNKLVPSRIPEVPLYDLAKVYQPAKDVGGDYLDFFPVEKNRFAIIVADVSGKGVSGAMVMVMVRSVFKMVSLLGKPPAETVIHANKILAKDIKKGMFVSLIYGILDAGRHVLHFVNAGHNLPLFYSSRKRKVIMLRSPGMVLGINTSQIFQNTLEEFAVRLAPGDKVVLYTDGVNEAKDDAGQDFGNDNLTAVVETASDGPSSHIVRALLNGIDAHRAGAPQSDDITIFAVGRRAH